MGLMRHSLTQTLAFHCLSVSHPFYGDNASWA